MPLQDRGPPAPQVTPAQGEQAVLCYLPLFAAAAAHFTSIGAAPFAPRFVLLDDAFPKIDVRTHPLLFGLLVDLDLDFVITNERSAASEPNIGARTTILSRTGEEGWGEGSGLGRRR